MDVVQILPSDSQCQLQQGLQKRRRYRRPALAPVVEHYEGPCWDAEEEEEAEVRTQLCSQVPRHSQTTAAVKKGPASKLRLLFRLRDAYIKLMNDVACGVDSSGVSSFYAGSAGGDYSAAIHARLRKEREAERERQLQAIRLQAL